VNFGLRIAGMKNKSIVKAAVALILAGACHGAWAQSEGEALEEVRNTVINLLEALVQKGVMTREQAEGMVTAAQEKAAASTATKAAQAAVESDAVRVTYVPEIVKAQIREEVRTELTAEVTKDVMEQAKEQRWGVPGALPAWINDVRLYGDVRTRAEGVQYADDNLIPGVPSAVYPNFNAINDAGGILRAGDAAILNATEDRTRLVGRVRTGIEAKLGDSFWLDLRLASGNLRSPVSTNQTLGSNGERWTLGVDRAALLWNPLDGQARQELALRFGRFANPFATANELVWDNDLTFEGIAATYAFDLFNRNSAEMERGLFLTVGAFPLEEVELSSDDKWLFGAQLGTQFAFSDHASLRFAAAYYDYRNITGIRNTPESYLFDYTAPRFLQKGNTLFDIRNSADTTQNLFALAGEYRLLSTNMWLDLGFGATHVMFGAEYVKNIGWDNEDVAQRIGVLRNERTEGYDVGVIVGRPQLAALGDWRVFALYRYLERDAVLDAFTDSDFHLGGTDAKGFQLGLDLGLSRGAWLRLRYLSADDIDDGDAVVMPVDLPLGIDVWQLDLNGQF
jgi:Putative porin